MNANLNEASLIYEHRSRIRALEKEVELIRTPSDEMRVLLGRLDERMKQIDSRLASVERKLIPTGEHLEVMKAMESHEKRLDTLEEWRIKFLAQVSAYVAIASLIGPIVVAFLRDFIGNLIS